MFAAITKSSEQRYARVQLSNYRSALFKKDVQQIRAVCNTAFNRLTTSQNVLKNIQFWVAQSIWGKGLLSVGQASTTKLVSHICPETVISYREKLVIRNMLKNRFGC